VRGQAIPAGPSARALAFDERVVSNGSAERFKPAEPRSKLGVEKPGLSGVLGRVQMAHFLK
jgi:hypothetical protein